MTPIPVQGRAIGEGGPAVRIGDTGPSGAGLRITDQRTAASSNWPGESTAWRRPPASMSCESRMGLGEDPRCVRSHVGGSSSLVNVS